MLLYIVRHGEPDYNADSLVERGFKQAEAVAKSLFKAGVNQIYSSPLGRAIKTAEPLCRLLNKDYIIQDWASEIAVNVECSNGDKKPVATVKNIGARDVDRQAFVSQESLDFYNYIEKEGNAFLEKLGYRYENGNYRILYPNEDKVVLFCHGNIARVWLSSLLRVPLLTMMTSFGYEHTGVTVVHFENNKDGITAPRCLIYSDISHLYAHGPETNYNGDEKLKI